MPCSRPTPTPVWSVLTGIPPHGGVERQPLGHLTTGLALVGGLRRLLRADVGRRARHDGGPADRAPRPVRMSFAVASPTPHPESGQGPIRVMVVDDAVVVRGLLTRWIEAEAGPADRRLDAQRPRGDRAARTGQPGRRHPRRRHAGYRRHHGAAALLKKKRDLVVIMASTLTRRNAEISLRALSLGAADYIPKPQTTREITTSTSFRRELIERSGRSGRAASPACRSRRPSRAGRPGERRCGASQALVRGALSPQLHDRS